MYTRRAAVCGGGGGSGDSVVGATLYFWWASGGCCEPFDARRPRWCALLLSNRAAAHRLLTLCNRDLTIYC